MFPILKKLIKPLVYITRRNALGDVLWMEPVIRQLAANHARVVVLTPYLQLFENYPLANVVFKGEPDKLDRFLIKQVVQKRLKGKGFIDLNMAYESKPNMHMLRAYFEASGYPDIELSYPQLFLSASEKKKTLSGKYVLIHMDPGSVSLNFRSVHGVDWVRVVQHLRGSGFDPIFISENNAGDRFGARTINPGIRELMSLIYSCDLFIGVDSGPSQLSAAMGKRSIIFFGSVNPWFRQLKDAFNGTILQKHCEFAGCYHDSLGTNGKICQLVGYAAITPCCYITTEELIEAVNNNINNR